MKYLNLAAAGAVGCLAIAPIVVACGSGDDPVEPGAGSGPVAGSGNSGAPSGGKSGGAGAAGAAAGSLNGAGGSSMGGASGTSGAGKGGMPAGGSAGALTGGMGGTSLPGGGSAGALGGSGGGAGTSLGGAAGGGGTGVIGTATFTVEHHLASDEDPEAPGTVGIVTWTVDKTPLVEAHIDFGLDTTYGTAAPVDLALTDHRTLLLGMKPAKTYHFRVVASDASATYQSEDFSIDTDAATNLVPLESFEVMTPGAHRPGFIMASYWQGTGMAVPFILDADGDVVWWFAHGPNGIARARMSADGKNMWMISASNQGAPLQRVSMDGLDAQTYGSAVGSHDITAVEGATMAYLDYSESDCNSIFEIDPSGTTKEVFDSQTVVSGMGCHGNALRYSKAEDLYTFSDVSTDIYVLNRMGQVQWKLSERVTGGNGAWGGIQHGHQLLENSILIFANSGASGSESAAIEYSFEGEELLNFSSGDYSANLGDVQRLPGGNTLVTFSNDSIIKEIDPQKNVVLAINGGGSRLGYALWTPSLYDPAPDIDE